MRESARAGELRHRGPDQHIVPRHRPHAGNPVPRRAAKGRSKRRPGNPENGRTGPQAGQPGQLKSGSSVHRAGRTNRLGAGGHDPKKDQDQGLVKVGLLVTGQRGGSSLTSVRQVPASGGKGSSLANRPSAGKPAHSRTGDQGRMSGPGPGLARAVPLVTEQRSAIALTDDRLARDRRRTADRQAALRLVSQVPVLAIGQHVQRAEVPVPKAGQDGSGTAVPAGRPEKAAADRR